MRILKLNYPQYQIPLHLGPQRKSDLNLHMCNGIIFIMQISALRKELEDTRQAMVELENKLKFKEETAAAAMAARDAAEKSLRLADLRAARLRERLEELTRQLEEYDSRGETTNRNSHRYICWPWQWLGLNSVRYQQADIQENSNEMELSEPLI